MSSAEAEQADGTPPVTGVPEIDQALVALDLTGPVSGHHERLGAVHDVLQRALSGPREASEPS